VSIPEPLQVLTTIRDFVRWGSSEFLRNELSFGHGFINALDEARYLVLHALSLPFDLPDGYFDATLTIAERAQVIEILQQRVDSRQPAAYLTRESWFCGLRFYVDERVLVPRSPLAELIHNCFSPWIAPSEVRRVVDLGTGSGCIAIATALAFPESVVDAADICEDALAVADINIQRHGLEERVRTIKSDFFDALVDERYDLIISNPPYVDQADMASRASEFRHEPELGLAAGQDGLDCAHKILQDASRFLTDNGILVCEVGNSQAALEAAYPELPFVWLDFEQGGAGVFLLTRIDLDLIR